MQGTLNEIDISSILQLVELGQRTGELLVEAEPYSIGWRTEVNHLTYHWQPDSNLRSSSYPQTRPYWFVFFVNGQIVYAADGNNSSLLRLRDYLGRYQAQDLLNQFQSPTLASNNELEYAYLWLLLEEHILTPAQVRSIIENMVRETLFDLLSLNQGRFVLETAPALAPLLTTVEIGSLVKKTMQQVQQWKQFYPQLQSPDQCPVIADDLNLRSSLKESSYTKLSRWINGQTSVRQLSRYLNRDLLTIGRAIYPYVQKGWVQLTSLNTQVLRSVPDLDEPIIQTDATHIVYIDDEVTTGKMVESILTEEGYKTTIIGDPLQALSLVFQIKPDLILCDIAMPKLDGYELCAMLRQARVFRPIPIIMLTGKDGFIDRVQARMVGSTDYLTKPFGKSELLMLLEKYLGTYTSTHLSHNR